MIDARDKLMEAKYFLNLMIESQNDRNAFRYSLSAFLSAFKSVDYLMENEFKGNADFHRWHRSKESAVKGNKKMETLLKKRIMTVHLFPVQPKAQVKATFTSQIRISSSALAVVKSDDGASQRIESSGQKSSQPAVKNEDKVTFKWYFEEIPDVDVITACTQCLVELETIVSECEKKFG